MQPSPVTVNFGINSEASITLDSCCVSFSDAPMAAVNGPVQNVKVTVDEQENVQK